MEETQSHRAEFCKIKDYPLTETSYGQYKAEITTINKKPYLSLVKYVHDGQGNNYPSKGANLLLPMEGWFSLNSAANEISNDLRQLQRMQIVTC